MKSVILKIEVALESSEKDDLKAVYAAAGDIDAIQEAISEVGHLVSLGISVDTTPF